jgi:hypothetical protein
MEADNVIFSANADSLDSWDIENLKFLRKISIKNPNRKSDMETLSYVSERESFIEEPADMLETALYVTGSDHIMKQHIREDSYLLKRVKSVNDAVIRLSLKPRLKPRVLATLPKMDRSKDQVPPLLKLNTSSSRPRKSIFDSLDMTVNMSTAVVTPTPSTSFQKPLEDCYVMDVLMVRNESVLTDSLTKTSTSIATRRKSPPVKLLPTAVLSEDDRRDSTSTPESIRKEMTLLRYSSSSPTSLSSDDSFASAIEKGGIFLTQLHYKVKILTLC